MTEIDWKKAFECLAEANRLGICIIEADGHWWITSEETYAGFDYAEHLKKHGVSVNNKIYGGIFAALAVIDDSLRLCGGRGLVYTTEYLGIYIPDAGRITKTEPGDGGLN